MGRRPKAGRVFVRSVVLLGWGGCLAPTLTYATSVGYLASFGLPWRRRAGCQASLGVTRGSAIAGTASDPALRPVRLAWHYRREL